MSLDTHLITRPLQSQDISKGYIQLLSQLSPTCETSDLGFNSACDFFLKNSETYHIYVIENTLTNTIIASGTLLIEQKIIHNCSKVGHIEDIIIDQDYRGMKLGKRIIQHLVEKAKAIKCYKIILDCNEDNVEFYRKLGFETNSVHMAMYLPKN